MVGNPDSHCKDVMSIIKVAIVDDEVRNIHILRNILENYCKDKVISEAQNIHEAAEMIKNNPIDVLIPGY